MDRALRGGRPAGYAGDVWYPQPALADHPWRTMPHHVARDRRRGLTGRAPGPHTSPDRDRTELDSFPRQTQLSE
ncbi:hypothetical protein TNCT6_60230 [Streptomyces sp. 6-11-2]|nr:hypothetical protein TNCT6_60230 [Streptomyces sp. 6-11-2]